MNEEKEDSEDFGFNIHYHKEDESEDIPFREYWKRETVESIKETLCSWIDDNLEHESVTNYDIYSKEDETRLYVKIHEENSEDQESEDQENELEDYYCVFKKYDTKEVEMTDVKF